MLRVRHGPTARRLPGLRTTSTEEAGKDLRSTRLLQPPAPTERHQPVLLQRLQDGPYRSPRPAAQHGSILPTMRNDDPGSSRTVRALLLHDPRQVGRPGSLPWW